MGSRSDRHYISYVLRETSMEHGRHGLEIVFRQTPVHEDKINSNFLASGDYRRYQFIVRHESAWVRPEDRVQKKVLHLDPKLREQQRVAQGQSRN